MTEAFKERAGASKPTIPTTDEMRAGLLQALRDMDSPKIQCQVEGMLKEKGHRWIWTPPYCPWLQPVRQHSSSSSAAAAAARTQRTSGIEPNVRARV